MAIFALTGLYIFVGVVIHCFKNDNWSVIKDAVAWPWDFYNLYFGKNK